MLRKILVIDTNEADRNALCSVLYGHFIVLEADGAQSAQRVLAVNGQNLSAVLISIQRAAEEALPLLAHMRSFAIMHQAPVVVLAAERDDEAEYRLLSSGAKDYLPRSVPLNILRQRISNLINLREMSAIGNEFVKSKQTTQRLQAIMDHVGCGIVAARIENDRAEILFSNNRYYEMLGYDKAVYNRRFSGGIGPVFAEDFKRVRDVCREINITGKPVDLTYRAVRADGELIWLRQSIVVTKLMGISGDVQLGVIYDITAEKRADEANRAKSEFLSRISHDMRTPMNAILGLVSLALDAENEPQTVEYLKGIDTASRYLLDLINDVLDMRKIEIGMMELHEAPYPGEEFEQYIATMILPLMEKKKLHFSCRANCGMGNIVVDKVRFNQIITNLLSNAVKYTPEGGHIELIAESIPDRDGKHGLRFRVRDDGIGMQPEFLKCVFEPYMRENRGEVPQAGSSGLGLAIVKRIVEAMGGSIQVTSTPGVGSEFTVDLYAYEASRDAMRKKEAIDSFVSLKGLNALLVEDNDLNILVLQRLLERKGCSVTAVHDGKEASECFAASAPGSFGVILMDLRMPNMDGYEAAKRIRAMEHADAKTVPIIAMTADAFSDDRERTAECGMNAFLTKPIVPEVLYGVISEAVFSRTA